MSFWKPTDNESKKAFEEWFSKEYKENNAKRTLQEEKEFQQEKASLFHAWCGGTKYMATKLISAKI